MKKLCLLMAGMGFGVLAYGAPLLINGAGSTFAAPLYAKWIVEYKSVEPSVEVNYQAIGSGGGVRQFLAGTTDFGASDDPMKPEEMKQAKSGVIHVPTAIGAVALIFNLKDVKELKLSAEVLAAIFMGKITHWNDPRLQALNPDAILPKQYIVLCHRADGSGTTAVFTEYLSRVSPDWLKVVGKGKSVKFPSGLGGKGNEGVTGLVKQNPGAIGYVEMTFARVNRLAVAAIKNKSGAFVEPSVESVAASVKGLKSVPQDLRMDIVNASGAQAYPITAFTYLLVPSAMPGEKGQRLVDFLKWAIGPGQKFATDLHYGSLPESISERASQLIKSIKVQ